MAEQHPAVDEVDLRILAALVRDARLSQRALGREVGMSSPAVAERLAKLEAAEVIAGYRAVLNWAALGRGSEVVVEIVSERSMDARDLAEEALEISEVESVEIVAGQVDLRLRLRVRDHEHLQQIFFERLLPMRGVLHTHTTLVMETRSPDNYAAQLLDQILAQRS